MFKNKYRIESSRLKNWDYASSGYYFITICTKNRECLFGKITNGLMELSDMGQIASRQWNESFNIRKELSCDCFMMMRNHIHGIIIIDDKLVYTHDTIVNTHNTIIDTHGTIVETHGRASLRNNGIAYREPKSVSSFVAGVKSVITKQINEYRSSPGIPIWQPRFYDHVIRNQHDLNRIRNYILNNPQKWQEDGFYKIQ